MSPLPLPPILSTPYQDLKPVIDGMNGIKISQGARAAGLRPDQGHRARELRQVLLVRLKKSDQVYAMKVVKKELVHGRRGETACVPRCSVARSCPTL